jgi:membrane-bound lytic murein transglycosylase B
MDDHKKKSVTLDDLAVIVQSGFVKAKEDNESLATKMAEGFVKSKEDNESLATKMAEGFVKSKEDNESLAAMVAQGFDEITNKMATKEDFNKLSIKVDNLSDKVGGLDHQSQALHSNVNNYLELSEKRYSELKQRDAILAKWLKLVADKTGVPIDISQLEKI